MSTQTDFDQGQMGWKSQMDCDTCRQSFLVTLNQASAPATSAQRGYSLQNQAQNISISTGKVPQSLGSLASKYYINVKT